MARRCSQCSNYGHNSRTCPARARGVRLFGVRLWEGAGSMKRSASMGCLSSVATAPPNNWGSPSSDPLRDHAAGYASDGTALATRSSIQRTGRKKGIPWTDEEHRMFLLGLQKLGKGDWRGIARNFVVSKTPAQVASHAQKYFIRQTNPSRKRRSSLFDTFPETPVNNLPVLKEQHNLHSPPSESESSNRSPSFNLCQDQGSKPTERSSSNLPELKEYPTYCPTPIPMVPAFYPALIPLPYAFWPPTLATPRREEMGETHEVLKPTPVLPKDQVNVEAIADMSKLGTASGIEPVALSLQMPGASSSGQPVFHINPTIAGSGLSLSSNNAIHAV